MDTCTRCIHFFSLFDVVAIQCYCCRTFFACSDCHLQIKGYKPKQWPQTMWHQKAIFCGLCQSFFTIEQYLSSQFCCPHCRGPWNPRCAFHWSRYFLLNPL